MGPAGRSNDVDGNPQSVDGADEPGRVVPARATSPRAARLRPAAPESTAGRASIPGGRHGVPPRRPGTAPPTCARTAGGRDDVGGCRAGRDRRVGTVVAAAHARDVPARTFRRAARAPRPGRRRSRRGCGRCCPRRVDRPVRPDTDGRNARDGCGLRRRHRRSPHDLVVPRGPLAASGSPDPQPGRRRCHEPCRGPDRDRAPAARHGDPGRVRRPRRTVTTGHARRARSRHHPGDAPASGDAVRRPRRRRHRSIGDHPSASDHGSARRAAEHGHDVVRRPDSKPTGGGDRSPCRCPARTAAPRRCRPQSDGQARPGPRDRRPRRCHPGSRARPDRTGDSRRQSWTHLLPSAPARVQQRGDRRVEVPHHAPRLRRCPRRAAGDGRRRPGDPSRSIPAEDEPRRAATAASTSSRARCRSSALDRMRSG